MFGISLWHVETIFKSRIAPLSMNIVIIILVISNTDLFFGYRGVKNTMWEGGVRGVGFINSPLLGNNSYISDNLFHVTDWLPTLIRAAGGDPSVLKKQDGFDMFDMLRNNGPAVRKEVLHNIDPWGNFSAIRVGDFKLIAGNIPNVDNSWYPPPEVSESTGSIRSHSLKFTSEHKRLNSVPQNPVMKENLPGAPINVQCGQKPLNASFNCQPVHSPCLFHIPSDPCEFNNVAALYPSVVSQLMQRLNELKETMVPPNNKPIDPNGNPFNHGGVWKPWQ